MQDARALAACFWLVTGAGLQAFGVVPSFRGVFPAFCLPYRLVSGWSLANMPLFRVLRAFLARFGVVVWVCSLGVLCVACRAFVCVSG